MDTQPGRYNGYHSINSPRAIIEHHQKTTDTVINLAVTQYLFLETYLQALKSVEDESIDPQLLTQIKELEIYLTEQIPRQAKIYKNEFQLNLSHISISLLVKIALQSRDSNMVLFFTNSILEAELGGGNRFFKGELGLVRKQFFDLLVTEAETEFGIMSAVSSHIAKQVFRDEASKNTFETISPNLTLLFQMLINCFLDDLSKEIPTGEYIDLSTLADSFGGEFWLLLLKDELTNEEKSSTIEILENIFKTSPQPPN